MRLVATLKVVRCFGVLAGIFLLLSDEHPPRDFATYLLVTFSFAAGFFTCIPFSRLRTGVVFWPVFSLYAVLIAAFAGFFGWRLLQLLSTFAPTDIRNMELLGMLVMLGVVFLLVLAQPACIYILRRHKDAA